MPAKGASSRGSVSSPWRKESPPGKRQRRSGWLAEMPSLLSPLPLGRHKEARPPQQPPSLQLSPGLLRGSGRSRPAVAQSGPPPARRAPLFCAPGAAPLDSHLPGFPLPPLIPPLPWAEASQGLLQPGQRQETPPAPACVRGGRDPPGSCKRGEFRRLAGVCVCVGGGGPDAFKQTTTMPSEQLNLPREPLSDIFQGRPGYMKHLMIARPAERVKVGGRERQREGGREGREGRGRERGCDQAERQHTGNLSEPRKKRKW